MLLVVGFLAFYNTFEADSIAALLASYASVPLVAYALFYGCMNVRSFFGRVWERISVRGARHTSSTRGIDAIDVVELGLFAHLVLYPPYIRESLERMDAWPLFFCILLLAAGVAHLNRRRLAFDHFGAEGPI